MQRGEDHVPRFGRRDRRFDRLQVAHLADQNHVRVLPQRAADGLGERGHVDPQFALVHRRLLVRVVELDGVLDRDNVMVEVLVDIVDHRRQGRGLARSRRPGHQHQSARPRAEFGQHGRRPQLVEGQELGRNQPQHHPNATLLFEDRHAEPAYVAEGETEVAAAHLLQFLLAPLRRDALHQRHAVLRLQHLCLEADQVAVDANHRRLTHGYVQIAPLAIDDRLEQFVDQNTCHLPLFPR